MGVVYAISGESEGPSRSRRFEVENDVLDGEGLAAHMHDLAPADVVLVVGSSGIPPEDVFHGGAVGAIILQHFASTLPMKDEAPVVVTRSDGRRREALPAARNLT